MNPPRIVEIDRPGPELEAVYRDLLEPHFPPNELDALDDMAESLTAGSASVLVALDDDGERLGVAVGDWDGASRVQLLSYLAVDPSRRSGGVGGRLLAAALERWTELHRPCAIVAEIEHPAQAVDDAWGDPRRRLEFYARHGAKVFDLPYFQPALREGAERAWGMLLIALHLDADFMTAPDRAAAGPVLRFLRGSFLATEERLPDDPAGKALMAAAADPDGIRLLDPADADRDRLPRSTP